MPWIEPGEQASKDPWNTELKTKKRMPWIVRFFIGIIIAILVIFIVIPASYILIPILIPVIDSGVITMVLLTLIAGLIIANIL